MKEYMVFISYREKFDIIKQSGKNRDDVISSLRKLGYKITLCLSIKTYEEYQGIESDVLFETYLGLFSEGRQRRIREIMYGEGVEENVG